jgi:hypothetical protein
MANVILYKHLCRSFNKSVFNWTFCQLIRNSRKTKLHKNMYGFEFLMELTREY